MEKGFPYPKHRNKISDQEIKNAIPQQGETRIFRTQEEAAQYAKLTQEYRVGPDDSYIASFFKVQASVFKVRLKGTIEGDITKMEIKSSSRLASSKTTQVEYVTVNASQLNFISGSVPGYENKVYMESDKSAEAEQSAEAAHKKDM
ncbi:hypothetical protein [Legionella sp. W10-070]|uniref:hypothetical protein n=1 Tax=Legionella sp. W10-070 TaxID=1117709 RepID=UPI001056A73A|nr:hypothetical protein [Legionella sp. W10-070]